jgi:tight adherence protein C
LTKSMTAAGWFAWIAVVLLFIGIDTFKQRERAGYEKLFELNKNPLITLAERLGPVIAAWFPVANIEGLEQLMIWAGRPYGLTAELFIGIKVVAMSIGFVAGSGLTLIGFPSIFAVLLAAISYFIPDYFIRGKAEQRQKSIRTELPMMLDFLVTSLKAGVELVPAINIIGGQLHGPLGEELRKSTREIMTGKQRAHALKAMAQRTGVEEVERFVQTLIVTEERGSGNIAESMDEYTIELRTSKLRRAEEEARKLPTKIVGPLILCIFLPMVILLMAPVMSVISKSL